MLDGDLLAENVLLVLVNMSVLVLVRFKVDFLLTRDLDYDHLGGVVLLKLYLDLAEDSLARDMGGLRKEDLHAPVLVEMFRF